MDGLDVLFLLISYHTLRPAFPLVEGEFKRLYEMRKNLCNTYLWCNQAKSVWSWSNLVFFLLTICMHHFHSYILQKTPLKLVNWFQRYEQLKDQKTNRKQKHIFYFVWPYLKINSSEFRLILLDHITFLYTKEMNSVLKISMKCVYGEHNLA